MNSDSALQQYKQTGLHSSIGEASPHLLIKMLLEGVQEKLCTARLAIEQNEMAKKGEMIGGAIAIIDYQRASLIPTAESDISDNLRDLYDYMEKQLVIASTESKTEVIDEVLALVREIQTGWSGIPEEARTP